MQEEIEIYAAIIKHRVAMDGSGCADGSGAAPHADIVVEGMWPNVPSTRFANMSGWRFRSG